MKLLSIFLLVVLPSAIFAQTNYHPGYVLKSSGDTLKGFIDYREWDESPKSIDFKTNKNDEQIVKFEPISIKGFEITGLETYISYGGLITTDRNHLPELEFSLDTNRIPAHIFLRQVTTGNHLSLYSQTDERKTRYFIAEGQNMPVELKYNWYYNENHDAVERTIYRGQLIVYINEYAPGNHALISLAESLPFEVDRFEEIVKKINNDTASIVKSQSKQSNIRWYLGAGALLTATQGSSSISITPQFNVGLDMFDNPNVQQWIFRANLSLSLASIKAPYYTGNTLSFDQYSAALTPQIIYNIYNRDNLKVYVDGGISLNLSLYSNNQYSDPSAVSSSGNNDLRNIWFGLPLQTGVVINKKWEASFTYAPHSKIIPNFSDAINSNSFCLGLKFFLDGK